MWRKDAVSGYWLPTKRNKNTVSSFPPKEYFSVVDHGLEETLRIVFDRQLQLQRQQQLKSQPEESSVNQFSMEAGVHCLRNKATEEGIENVTSRQQITPRVLINQFNKIGSNQRLFGSSTPWRIVSKLVRFPRRSNESQDTKVQWKNNAQEEKPFARDSMKKEPLNIEKRQLVSSITLTDKQITQNETLYSELEAVLVMSLDQTLVSSPNRSIALLFDAWKATDDITGQKPSITPEIYELALGVRRQVAAKLHIMSELFQKEFILVEEERENKIKETIEISHSSVTSSVAPSSILRRCRSTSSKEVDISTDVESVDDRSRITEELKVAEENLENCEANYSSQLHHATSQNFFEQKRETSMSDVMQNKQLKKLPLESQPSIIVADQLCHKSAATLSLELPMLQKSSDQDVRKKFIHDKTKENKTVHKRKDDSADKKIVKKKSIESKDQQTREPLIIPAEQISTCLATLYETDGYEKHDGILDRNKKMFNNFIDHLIAQYRDETIDFIVIEFIGMLMNSGFSCEDACRIGFSRWKLQLDKEDKIDASATYPIERLREPRRFCNGPIKPEEFTHILRQRELHSNKFIV